MLTMARTSPLVTAGFSYKAGAETTPKFRENVEFLSVFEFWRGVEG